jgi:ABC-2 type transport system ATP-binding protein
MFTSTAQGEHAMAGEPIIELRGLRKRYGRTTALDGLDLTVTQGEIFGFLGPNGAGKSTTIRILLGLIRANSGTATVFGLPAGTVASRDGARIGALVEEPAFYPYLSGRRNLELFASLSGRVDPGRIDRVLDMVNLRHRQHDRYHGYSHGMKQRLGIAQALIPQPQLLILDEPASGLDPQGLVEVRDLLQQVSAEEGVTVFLSSHLLHEVEIICTDAAMVNHGRVVRRDRVANLLAEPETAVKVRVDDLARGQQILQALTFVTGVEPRDDVLRVVCAPDAIADVNGALVAAGLRVSSLERERLTLEELYMQLIA